MNASARRTPTDPVRLGCSSCIYEAGATGKKVARFLDVPEATREVLTPNGPRQVCDDHARALTLPGSK